MSGRTDGQMNVWGRLTHEQNRAQDSAPDPVRHPVEFSRRILVYKVTSQLISHPPHPHPSPGKGATHHESPFGRGGN